MDYLIVIFLLFTAVLIAAWFYLQRAKARDAAKASATQPEAAHRTEAPPEASADRPQ